MRTPLAEKINSTENALAASTALHSLARIGEPDEVTAAIALLLDPANSWVTGQVLGVVGGLASLERRAAR